MKGRGELVLNLFPLFLSFVLFLLYRNRGLQRLPFDKRLERETLMLSYVPFRQEREEPLLPVGAAIGSIHR